MAVTLVEAAKIALGREKVLEATVMELYAKSSDLLANLPFDTISGNAYTFNREKVLPDVGFRGINQPYKEGTGELENVVERLCIAGGDIDVDKFLVDTAGTDQRAVQETMKIKAISLKMTKTFIKGSVLDDPLAFDGLQVRIIGEQLVNAGSASGGDALSLSKLDELLDVVEDPTHLLMNKGMRRRITTAARNTAVGGYITYTLDAFGRKVTQYNDLPILIAFKDEKNAEIMPFNEPNPGGGANASTSIYALSLSDNGVMGLQGNDIEVRNLGEAPDKPVYRTRIEWYITLALLRSRCAGRLRGIKDAAVVA